MEMTETATNLLQLDLFGEKGANSLKDVGLYLQGLGEIVEKHHLYDGRDQVKIEDWDEGVHLGNEYVGNYIPAIDMIIRTNGVEILFEDLLNQYSTEKTRHVYIFSRGGFVGSYIHIENFWPKKPDEEIVPYPATHQMSDLYLHEALFSLNGETEPAFLMGGPIWNKFFEAAGRGQ